MTIFSRIISGDLPSYKIAENDKFYAFLDINPSAHGHTIVIPKIEVDRLFDLPENYLDGYLSFCKPVADAIKKAFYCERVNILTLGFEVPHAHIHLLPMNGMDDAGMITKKIQVSQVDLQADHQKILAAMNA